MLENMSQIEKKSYHIHCCFFWAKKLKVPDHPKTRLDACCMIVYHGKKVIECEISTCQKKRKKKVTLYSLFPQGHDQSKTRREDCPIIVWKKNDRAHYLNKGIEVPQSYIDGNKILIFKKELNPGLPHHSQQVNTMSFTACSKGFTSLQVNLKKKKKTHWGEKNKKLLWEVLMPGAGIEPHDGQSWHWTTAVHQYLSHAKIRK